MTLSCGVNLLEAVQQGEFYECNFRVAENGARSAPGDAIFQMARDMSAKGANVERTREGNAMNSSRTRPHIAYAETNEQRRLNETREKGSPVEKMGAVSQ